ncbi:MAG: Ldh family oxidoreductase, partial [Alphaproteobacteria bacterium]
MGEEKIRTSVAEVHRVVAAALVRAGCDGANADAVAAVVAAAERDGCASHGVFRLAGYLAALRSGKVDGAARPSVARIAPGVLRVDARSGFAPLAIGAAREALAPLAREQGLAAAAVVDAHHFSALWADVEPLAEAGLVAIAMTSYMPAVAPAGAR